ncbi:peptide/nickel transport system permease protein [Devosia enhydra]|uniref:Peptide/nickel transport system permease protein n=1 Tax=Devosia enhydra TaxID=665118 RepID=A0A1K2HY26_9HYPH|nr:ABC transporter permease [Devosia enhydra]SFZ84500.1 peptide/nickel transport system permease protein [Devosia enhydra]
MARILTNPKALIGLSIVALVLFAALFADVISPYDPLRQSLRARHLPPDTLHWLGTDHVGRDILSRIIHGARISVMVGIGAVGVSAALGMLVGLVAGYYGGVLGAFLMRAADIKLAMPMILFAIAWIAFFGGGLMSVIIVIGLWGWVPYARYARSIVLTLRESLFVEASVALGASSQSILFRHVAPNLVGPLIVIATLQLGEAVLLESALSFLGLGVQAPTPTWGSMVSDGRSYIDTAWWTVTFPGLAITFFVLGASFLGDALRDWLDPRST